MNTRILAALLTVWLLLPRAAAAKIPPPLSKDGRVPVKVGLYITDLVGVEEVAETFRIRGYLYESWKDPRLAYKPRDASDTFREADPARIWRPNLIGANAVSGQQVISTNIRVRPDGTLESWEDFHDEFTMEFTFHAFPFDTQILPIVIQPFLDERDAIAFTAAGPETGIETQSWGMLELWGVLGVTTNTHPASMGRGGIYTVPQLEFDLTVQRHWAFYVWKVFLPLFIMALISYCALWIKETDHAPQLSVSMSALLTQIAFLFVISNSLPRVPYLTYIDSFFLIGFLFGFSVLVELVVVHRAMENKNPVRAIAIRRASRRLFPVLYLLGHAVAAWVFFGAR